MATNPLIPLMAEVPNTDRFINSFLTGRNVRLQNEDRARAKELQPMEDDINQSKLEAYKAQITASNTGNEVNQLKINDATAMLGFDHASNLLSIADPVERARVHAEFERVNGGDDGNPDDLSDEALQAQARSLAPQALRAKAAQGGNVKTSEGLYVRDSEGNVFQQMNQSNNSGAVQSVFVPMNPNGADKPVGNVVNVDDSGMTPQEKASLTTDTARNTAVAQGNVTRANNNLDDARNIKSEVRTLREIQAMLKGVKGEVPRTGPVWSRLPNISASAVKLRQLGNKLGLNVVAGATFGALSESELNFALDTAFPAQLEGPELLKWVTDRANGQEKLAVELERAADMMFGGASPADVQKIFDGEAAQRAINNNKGLIGVPPELLEYMSDEDKERWKANQK